MIIKGKTPSTSLYNRDYNGGLILLRMVSKLPMGAMIIKDTIVNHMRGEVALNVEKGNLSEKRASLVLADLDEISTYPIVFTKSAIHQIQGQEYYYSQILLQIPQEKQRIVNTPTILGDMCSRLEGLVFTRQGSKYIVPGCAIEEYVYSVAVVHPCLLFQSLYIGSNREMLNMATQNIMTYDNNIAINTNYLTDRKFNRNTVFDTEYDIYDNLYEALNHRNKYTMVTCAYDNGYGLFLQRSIKDAGCGFTILKPYTPFKVQKYKDMLIIYDGNKGYQTIEPLFEVAHRNGCKLIELHQYGIGHDFFNHQIDYDEGHQVRKITIHCCAQANVEMRRDRMEYDSSSGHFAGCMYIRTPRRRVSWDVRLRNRKDILGYLVLPINDKGIQEEAIKHLKTLFQRILGEVDRDKGQEAFDNYLNCMCGDAITGEDVLSRWFVQCTKTRHQQDDSIVRAYNKMKENLEKEYKNISLYLNCYDFSKSMPVPSVKMDEKMAKNYYNTLHVEPENVIINSINNKKISPVEVVQASVKVMIPVKKQIVVGNYPLHRFYNNTTNSVELYYDKMKGEVIRDKIKNRR